MSKSSQPTRRRILSGAGSAVMASILPRRTYAATGGANPPVPAAAPAAPPPFPANPDICIYAATASGIMAAVAAAREGASVVIIEPSRWLGGMTGGGLMHIDWGREIAVAGSARDILKKDYNDPQYRAAFAALLASHRIPVLFEHRVSAVQRDGTTIKSITLDHAPPDARGCPRAEPQTPSAKTVNARVFIDCSYEGDLMARAGVSYTFGRESRETYGESLAGAQPPLAVYNIDPYRKPGDRSSGLLPLLQDLPLAPEGSADQLTMGYGFRWKLTEAPGRIPIPAPADYDPATFELYRRGFQNKAGIDKGRRSRKLGEFEEAGGRVHSTGMGNLARALLAPVNYGANAAYPDGSYATRARIWKAEQEFMSGMTHFIRTDPAVPDKFKILADKLGFEPGIFDDTAGWPHQLYVREARRMKSAYTVSQKDMSGLTNPGDSIGLASYGVDEWPYATIPLDGKVALVGGYYSMLYLEEANQGIYRIPYRAITPRAEECTNLLVPVCLSASHIAMTSIRMEPVWMILGESAGTAAAMAAKANSPVQQINYPQLREKLLALHQRLEIPA